MKSNKEHPYTLYYLVDPRKKKRFKVFYVGATQQPLHMRVVQHIHAAKNGQGNRRKMETINAILTAGLRPLIVEAGKCTRQEWQGMEKAGIALHKRYNPRLANVVEGGLGQNGLHHTDVTRRKIAASVSRARSERANVSPSSS